VIAAAREALAAVPAPVATTIACALASGLALRCFPALRGAPALAALGLCSTALVGGRGALGVLGVHLVILAITLRVLGTKPVPARHRSWRWKAGVASIGALVLVFFAGRAYGVEAPRGSPPVAIPLLFLDMWLVLRLVTFLWEAGSGRIADLSPSRYAAWALLPFTIGGPVLRYSELRPFLDAPPPPAPWNAVARRLAPALGALVGGFGLVPLVDVALRRYGHGDSTGAKALQVLLLGPWGFYWATAGLFGVMEASALLCGLTLPRSFESPFGRRNLAEFWARWNMTATRVFRDYAFMNRWGLARPNVYLNSLIVFGLCGAWHATNAYWIGWGLLHGLGFAIFLFFRQRVASRLPAGWLDSPYWRGGCAAATYLFVCSAWYVPSKLLQLVTG
jgi:hypothetical protein